MWINSISNKTATAPTRTSVSSSGTAGFADDLAAAQKRKAGQTDAGRMGIPVGELQDVTHLLTPIPPDPNHPIDPLPDYPTEKDISAFEDHMESRRYRRNTQALVWMDGKVVAEFNYDGSCSWGAEVEAVLHQSGLSWAMNSNPNEILALLGEKLPGKVEIASFQPGTGPTDAEKWEIVHGYSYDEHIAYAKELMRDTMAENRRHAADIAARQERLDAVEQRSVFSMNGVLLGSIDEEGRFKPCLASLIQEVDQAGLGRELVRDLLYASRFGGQTEQAVTNLLSQAFGDSLTVQQYEPGEGPDHGEIRTRSTQQFCDRYYAIHGE